jgi:MSHA biogenesis protein MshK
MNGERQKAEGRRRKGIARSAGAALVLVALAGCASAALAQVMNDPTRPPSGFMTGESEAATDTGGAIMLQTVMISPTHKAAIINGVLVRLGEKYGDAVLVGVAENEVVLKSGGAQQVLKLHPGVEKREIGPTAATGAPRAKKTRSGAEPAGAGGAPAR